MALGDRSHADLAYERKSSFLTKTGLVHNPRLWLQAKEHKLSSIVSNRTDLEEVNSILRDYDFIGVTERMDESAVALQMLLGLKTSDVMYLKR